MKIKNNLQKNRFMMIFTDELYNLQNDIYSVTLPSLTLSSVEVNAYGGTKYKKSGDDMDFGQLIISIKIDEDLSNLMKFYGWAFELFNPETGEKKEKTMPGTLQIYGSNDKVIKEIDFVNLRIASIPDVTFESNIQYPDFEVAEIIFDFDRFSIK